MMAAENGNTALVKLLAEGGLNRVEEEYEVSRKHVLCNFNIERRMLTPTMNAVSRNY